MYWFVFDKNTINAQKLGEYLLYLKEWIFLQLIWVLIPKYLIFKITNSEAATGGVL